VIKISTQTPKHHSTRANDYTISAVVVVICLFVTANSLQLSSLPKQTYTVFSKGGHLEKKCHDAGWLWFLLEF